MQFDDYSMYSASVNNLSVDTVDSFLRDLQLLNSYNEVVSYINDKFGKIDSKKVIEYPELNKQIEIVFKEDAVEFFAAEDWTQYYGKGWRKESD